MKKILLITAIILTILITFIEAYDARDVENISYIIAIGIDKSDSKEEPLRLSIQIAKPDTSEGNGTKITTQIETVNCNSFNLGLSMLNLKDINELNLSHCNVILISEELAKDGIEDFINTLANNVQIRPTCNILVTQGKTEDFLNVASKIDDISAKFYSSFINSSQITSYITPCKLSNFYSSLHDDTKAPVALYSFINKNTIESIGLSVFKDYKMVGRLSGLDTICYNLLTNEFKEATIEVYNPQQTNIPITVNISHYYNTKIDLTLDNNIPKIKCIINVKANILSGNKSFNYSSEENLQEIEAEINKFIEKNTLALLYKTSRGYESDIIGFNGYFRKNFLTKDELDKYNWDELYKNSEFEIEAHSYLKSGFLFSKN